MGKKVLRIVLLCFALAVLLTVGAAADDIYTAADLANMAGKDGTYYLRNDLDLTEYGNWTPITFAGTFDGQGHTIKVVVNDPGNVNAGLFSTLNGNVSNLRLEVDITGSSTKGYATGGLAGELRGSINGVSVSGTVRGTSNTGGLVGYCRRTNNQAADQGLISNCYSAVNVTASGQNGDTVGSGCGGLVGRLGYYRFDGYNTYVYRGYITNCYASGRITIPETYDKNYYRYNGLVGFMSNNSVVTNSYYCNYNNSQYSGAGAYIPIEDMKQQSTYVDWDFSTIWRISPSRNNGFPYLRDPEAVSPTDVSLNWTTLTLEPEDAQMLQATILPANATSRHLDWYSSDTDIVELTPVANSTSGEINARMMVNAKTPGTAIVTAVTTDGHIEAACTVTVSSGESEPLPVYRLNRITIQDSAGKTLTAIPSSSFLATLSVTNIASADSPTIMLAAYTAAGQYAGLFYVTLKSPVGGTIEATVPVDNSGGNIAQLKAFAIASFADMTPLGSPVTFPAA